MKRGGMYGRDMQAMPGCVTFLAIWFVVSSFLATATIIVGLAKLLA